MLLSMHAREDGVLFEYFDDTMENRWTLTIREYVDAWEKGAIYGSQAGRPTAAVQ